MRAISLLRSIIHPPGMVLRRVQRVGTLDLPVLRDYQLLQLADNSAPCHHIYHKGVNMRRLLVHGVLLSLLFSLCYTAAQAQSIQSYENHEVTADGLLVRARTGLTDNAINDVNTKIGGRLVRKFARLGWQQVQLPAGMSISDAVARYKASGQFTSVEPNYIYHATTTSFNDPKAVSLWGLTRIQAPNAWDTTTGSANVVVAVVDTGVDYNHPDLSANIWKNTGEVAGNGVDDDGDGYIDDVHGYDMANHDGDPMDDKGHGTHVAGTIGAVGNNGIGVAGINWTVKILPMKFMKSDGTGNTADALACYDYLISLKKRGVNIRVVNNSWGGGGYSQSLKDAIDTAGSLGILTVCAAGNGGSDMVGDNNDVTPYYPANYDSPSLISVAASNQTDAIDSFSNYGATTVDIAAPGDSITSTYLNSGYISMSGTSMATPHVAGSAALLLAKNSTLTVADVKAALLNNVDKLSQWTGKVVSGGRLNLARAMQAVAGSGSTPPTPPPTFTYQPDILIRTSAATTYAGDNVYNTTGTNQTSTQTVGTGTASYVLQVQNDGNATDTFTLKSTTAASGWTVRYYDAVTGGNDITSQITGTGYRSYTLANGASQYLRVEVTAGSTVAGGATADLAITATSTTDASKADTIHATTSKTVTAGLTGVTLSASPVSPQPVNTLITLTAAATGSTSVEYKFIVGYQSSTGTNWTTLRSYASTPTAVWQPTQVGTYTLMVYAHQIGATTVVTKSLTYSVTTATSGSTLTGVTLTATPASPQRVNTAVTLSATPVGTSAAEYRFRVGYQSGTSWIWTTLRDYSTVANATWVPTVAHGYTIMVYARPVGNTTNIVARSMSYTVNP